MIPFNKTTLTWNEEKYVIEAMNSWKISWDNFFTKKCQQWFDDKFEIENGHTKTLLTSSCTHALEIMAILLDIKSWDEIIMPSYTFVSTANAFAIRWAKIIFVDIRPDTMNIDETIIEKAITKNTKAIVVVHYAWVWCEMDVISSIAKRHGLYLLEDAAQWMMCKYKNKSLWTIWHMWTFSFHETKNYTSWWEWWLLLINDKKFIERAQIIREKWTNRSQFFRWMIDKYSWVDIWSSYLMSDIQAAYLWWQLEKANEINSYRLDLWENYNRLLKFLENEWHIELPFVQNYINHNWHMFYIKTKDINERSDLIKFLKENGVVAVFHYIPLHSSPAWLKYWTFNYGDTYTTKESERIVRLPMYYWLKHEDQQYIVDIIEKFYRCRNNTI
ncbi:MAG: hypothetical protein ACD_4C00393G0005 [uncultured bacterium (gcode 4)]|uniref:Uncharacterized protein n=1 Tax=uncultured bacterium (gcode 4) TaxID=1234023 RepID=K2GSD0_9BACT|nr:MAG: hypothetical protein ACD_4C00393G0005 [uncultured bacterium (gcode 4)]